MLLPVLATLVGLSVVAGAALAGPWQVAPRELVPVETPQSTRSAPPQEVAEEEPPPEPSDDGGPAMVILAAIGLLLLALLLRALLRRATLARGTTGDSDEAPPGSVGTAEEVAVEPDLPALRRGATAARAVLATGTAPDDAIVAAWLELEAAAASSGVERAPSDTPTELTTAVLDATSADPAATRTLLRLYHRARFAPHAVMTAQDVSVAVDCLERLAASWEER